MRRIEAADKRDIEFLICDTAGRLPHEIESDGRARQSKTQPVKTRSECAA